MNMLRRMDAKSFFLIYSQKSPRGGVLRKVEINLNNFFPQSSEMTILKFFISEKILHWLKISEKIKSLRSISNLTQKK